MGIGCQFHKMKGSRRWMVVVVAQHCKCSWRHRIVHLKMGNIGNFVVYLTIIFKIGHNRKPRFYGFKGA